MKSAPVSAPAEEAAELEALELEAPRLIEAKPMISAMLHCLGGRGPARESTQEALVLFEYAAEPSLDPHDPHDPTEPAAEPCERTDPADEAKYPGAPTGPGGPGGPWAPWECTDPPDKDSLPE